MTDKTVKIKKDGCEPRIFMYLENRIQKWNDKKNIKTSEVIMEACKSRNENWFEKTNKMCIRDRFSRNYQKRAEENQKFLELKGKATTFLKREKEYFEQRKTHHIYKCPSCKQKIRVPKGKGKMCIRDSSWAMYASCALLLYSCHIFLSH